MDPKDVEKGSVIQKSNPSQPRTRDIPDDAHCR